MEDAESRAELARDPISFRDHRMETRRKRGCNSEMGFRHAGWTNLARILISFQRKIKLSQYFRKPQPAHGFCSK
jgi:hypothetical protein